MLWILCLLETHQRKRNRKTAGDVIIKVDGTVTDRLYGKLKKHCCKRHDCRFKIFTKFGSGMEHSFRFVRNTARVLKTNR